MPKQNNTPQHPRFPLLANAKNRVTLASTSVWKRLKKYPFIVLGVLLLLLGLTAGGAALTKKPQAQEEVPQPQPLKVQVVTVGSQTSNVEATGTIENLKSITLVAQTAGPVNKIHLVEGKQFQKGASITTQETGYGTGNAAAIGAQVAAKNLEISDVTLKNTVQSVSISRQLADKNRDNTEELRKISADSLGGTRKLLDTTKQVIAKIESDLSTATDAAIIQGLRQQLITYQNVLNGTESQLKNLEYSTNTDKAPTQLANLSKDQVYNATQLQLETSQLSRDIAALNLQSARIQASLTTVRAPFAGKVERVLVTQGQYVTPGTPIAIITGDKPELCLVTQVSGFTASRIDGESSMIATIGDTQYSVPITHVSSTPTSGSLYEVLAVLPADMASKIYEGQSVAVTLPTENASTISANTYFLPLDAVFVTNLEKYVFMFKDGKAIRTPVETGNIVGNDIEIKKGLNSGDQVIIDRRVIDGQAVVAEEKINALPNVQYLFNEATSSGSWK